MQTIADLWVVFICLAIGSYGKRLQSESFSPKREARTQAGEEQSLARLLAAFELGAGFQANAAPRPRPRGDSPRGSSTSLQQSCTKPCDVVPRAPAGVMQFGEGAKLEAETKAAKRRLKEAEDAIVVCKKKEESAKENVQEKEESFKVLKAAFDKARTELYNAQYDLTQTQDTIEAAIEEKENAVQALDDARAAEYAWLEENAIEAAANAGAKAAASAAGAIGSGLLTGLFGEAKSVKEAKAKKEKDAQQAAQKKTAKKEKEAPTEAKKEKEAQQAEEKKAAKAPAEASTEAEKLEEAEQSKKEKPADEQRNKDEIKTGAEEVKAKPQAEISTEETSEESEFESEDPSAMNAIDKELVEKRAEAMKLLMTRRPRTLTDSLASAAAESMLGVGGKLTEDLRENMKQEAKEEEKRMKFALFESDWAVFDISVDEAMVVDSRQLKRKYIKRLKAVHPDARQAVDLEDPEVKKRMQDFPSAAQTNAAYDTLKKLMSGQLGPEAKS